MGALKINQKSLYKWLIGLLASAVVSLLFVKVCDIVNFTWKSKYFNAVKKQFLEKGPATNLIDWKDSEGWRVFYEEQLKSEHDIKSVAESSEKLKDYCYSKVEEGLEKSFDNCWSPEGWCKTCIKEEKR